jgi:desulfoferrodoxin (superoxide reductase-like protein)
MAYAHAPSSLELAYDIDEHLLFVKVMHSVAKVNNHYVNKIEVALNGDKIVTQRIDSQSSPESQDVQYVIVDAEIGDEISVTAHCNIIGIKSVTITVTGKDAPEEEE